MASRTEKFLLNYVAPNLLNKKVKVVIFIAYTVWTAIACYGCTQIKTRYSLDFNWNNEKDYRSFGYFETKNKYFSDSFPVNVYVNLNETSTDDVLDISSREAQLQQVKLEEAMLRCETCDKKWFKPGSLTSWFREFRAWIDEGKCGLVPERIDPFIKTMEPMDYHYCL